MKRAARAAVRVAMWLATGFASCGAAFTALAANGSVPVPIPAAFAQLAQRCAPNVDPSTLAALVRTESGFNPYAIGVVGARLERQPASLPEALATVRELKSYGFSYSVGLTQVNNRNFAKYGETALTLFEPCRNLRAGAAILTGCFARSSGLPIDQQSALRAALSCYYSGNFTTGFRAGYVGKVVTNARIDALQGVVEPIPVVRDAHPLPTPHAGTSHAPFHDDAAPRRASAVDAQPSLSPVSDGHRRAPACSAHPLVTVCHGLSAAQIHALCVRCLDPR